VVVEAGTYLGRTACALAKVLRACNIEFHIYSAEIRPNFIEKAQKNIDGNGLTEHVTIFEGDYLEMLQVIEEPIDFAYIDGGVRWPMVEATVPLMSDGGMIFVDDMNTPWGDKEGYANTLALANITLPCNRGLSIIQCTKSSH
jgi:predicted O-methyltransferase YrrM